jgi:hypothetical protein
MAAYKIPEQLRETNLATGITMLPFIITAKLLLEI